MKNIAIAFAFVGSLGLVGMGVSSAKAAGPGLHFRAGGLHVDVGRPHGGFRGYASPAYSGRAYGSRPHTGYARGGRSSFGRSIGRGHYDYHDTTHLDWHPGSYQRHRNHFDFVPGHYDVHRTGHFDYHPGGYGHH